MFDGEYTAASIVGDDLARHARRIRESTGYDTFRCPHFWETWLAVQLGGSQTEHKNVSDIKVDIWGMGCFAEVKFSQSFWCRFSTIRGKDWSRNAFKWTITKNQDSPQSADALILMGVDVTDLIYSWVVPHSEICGRGRSITITAPSSRSKHAPGRLDKWSVPPTEILPAFARVCHNRYDAPVRRAGIRERQLARVAIRDLLADVSPEMPPAPGAKS